MLQIETMGGWRHGLLDLFRDVRRFLCHTMILTVMLWSVHAARAAPAPAAAGTGGSSREVEGQWLSYGRNYSEQRYSPLYAVNGDNVNRLGLQWTLDLPNESALVSTPLSVDGTLYFVGNFSVLYAVDARTGRLKWTYDPKTTEALAHLHSRSKVNTGASRGIAYWQHKLYVAPADGRLIAVSADNGKPLWSVQTFDPTSVRNTSGAPLAFNGKVLIGNGGGDSGPMRGYVTAYDAKSGRQLWRFYTVPGNPAKGFKSQAMKMAAATWTGDWWTWGGGGAVWNSMTYDPEFNRVYIGTGNGSPWNPKARSPEGGDNLFLASIVALDADSGRYVWHYQETPADAWDYDACVDMVLAEISIEGRQRKVLMQASKNGFFYVIDRQNGKLISAEPFVRTTWAKRIDLATGRPVEEPGMRPQEHEPGVTVSPTGYGAHSWPSMSFNPETELVYIPALDFDEYYSARDIDLKTWNPTPSLEWFGYSDVIGRELQNAPESPNAEKASGSANPLTNGGGGSFSASLQARNPVTNKTVWEVRQPGHWAGGTLTTRGNLTFIGQADGNLTAYDARTGRELWKFNAGRPISAPPIAYSVDGSQYISVLAGWGASPASDGAMGDPSLRMAYRDGGRRLLTFALDGHASASLPPPRSVDPIDVPGFVPDLAKVAQGQKIFDSTCNVCHGTNVFSGGLAPDLRASHLASDPNALRQIVHGALELRGMPRFETFSNDDIDAIYHYIRFQARRDLEDMRSK
jgi:quinohemoprotein ethanol dehydrogenase